MLVSLDNPPSSGVLVFRFYDSANAFGNLGEAAKRVKLLPQKNNRYVIRDLEPGTYALVIYHDENANGRLDENFAGIPTEPIAFSNRYQPKGPPSFRQARFYLAADAVRQMHLELYRPLGERGRIGVGIGVLGQTSPYKDSKQGVYQPIPAISYNGKRYKFLGPQLQVGLLGSGDLRFAAIVRYRLKAYEEDNSPFLDGLGDRKDTFMAGLAANYELGAGIEFSTRYEHDVLDRIGGKTARLEISKSFQWRDFRFSTSAGVNWLSPDFVRHEFGVPDDKATARRPAYTPDDAFTMKVGTGVFMEVLTDWWMVLSTGVEFLGSEITDSPIVSKDHLLKGFFAVNYVF
ncbi:MAG: MipA/OmpV family protein [Thermodesulfobacteriota bacterium]